MKRPLVIDASVAIKWVVAEADAALAEPLMQGTVLVPDLLLIECGNAIWRRVLRGDMAAATAVGLMRGLRQAPLRIASSSLLVEAALELALALRHPVYDCLYLALAIDQGTRLVTADRRFAQVVRASPEFGARVVLLGDLAH